MHLRHALLLSLFAFGCDDGADAIDVAPDAPLADAAPADAGVDAAPTPDADVPPPALESVAHTRFTVESEGRTLPVELWYPTDAAPIEAVPVWTAFLDGEDAETYRDLIEADRAHCATQAHAVPADAPAIGTDRPLVLMSHCHACTRFNMMTIAEHLAARGMIVAAPDHVSNTLFDALRGESVPVGPAFLPTRGADLGAVLDALLDLTLEGVAQDVAGRIDPARIGVLGHSFGAVTAGWILEHDPRVIAGVAVAAPMENPLVAGVTLENITQPTLHVVAVEDNSITELGNSLIRDNFAAIATPTYKLEVADAGHWSFSDLAGITEDFAPGCGAGARQTDREAFDYLEPDAAIPILAAAAEAFFRGYLADESAALDALVELDDPQVTVEIRP